MDGNTQTAKTIEVPWFIFASYGLPEQLVSDNEPQFVSEEFERFTTDYKIKHIRSAPYHPATNRAAERFIQTFKLAMKMNTDLSISCTSKGGFSVVRPYYTACHHKRSAVCAVSK